MLTDLKWPCWARQGVHIYAVVLILQAQSIVPVTAEMYAVCASRSVSRYCFSSAVRQRQRFRLCGRISDEQRT